MSKIGSGYIRVSTEDQEEYSPDSQIKILREYAKTHDIILPDEYIFRDDGISGRKAGNRPEFMRMISMAKSDDNPFEIILVWKFSRFARNQEESIVYKSLLKNQHNVEVISVSEPLPEGPFGSLVERIIEWTDEYYSIRLSGEVRRGMTERVSRGEAVTVAPYGYLIENGKLTVAEDEAQIVRMIYEDFLNGMSMYAIAAKTQNLGVKTKRGNVMRSRTIRYILTNPVYCGKLRWCPGGINDYTRSQIRDDTLIIDGQHSGIVDEATFAETEQRLQTHLKRYKSAQDKRVQRQDAGAKGDFMLRGLIKCSNCGSTLTRVKGGLQCCEYAHSACHVSHYVSMQIIEGMVLSALEQQFGNLDFNIIQKSAPLSAVDDAALIQKQIDKEKIVLGRIADAYAAGIDTLEEYRANKNKSQERILKLKSALQAVPKPDIDRVAFSEKHKQRLINLNNPDISPTEKNQILRLFVDHIIFNRSDTSIEIVYYN